MPDTNIPPPRIPVREAFAALPLHAPPRPAWPAVADRVRRRRPGRTRVAAWLAVAASAVLLAFWLAPLGGPSSPGDASAPSELARFDTSPPGPGSGGVGELVQRSQALEARLQAEPPALRSGSAVLAAEFIAADIGRIDAALAGAPPEDTALLWQARVALLVELDELRRTEMLAASGSGPLLALD